MPLSDKRYISFKNGVYDVIDDTLTEHSPGFIIPNQIPWNYNPDAFDLSMENALFDWCCDNEEIVELLEEVVGYSMYRENTFRKFFIITGNKRNGKSKFLRVLTEMIGEDNTSSIALEHIDTKFQNANLAGKLLNVGDDIESETYIKQTAALKKLTSGDRLTVERKGQDPFDFVSYATLVFSANGIPNITDESGAVKDRMIIIPFNARFEESSKKNNPNILDDLLTENGMEYLIRCGLEGLRRLLQNKRFTMPNYIKSIMDRYMIECDPVQAFLELNTGNIIGRPTAEVYRDYEIFCDDHSLTPIKLEGFSRKVIKILGCKTSAVKGKRFYKYV